MMTHVAASAFITAGNCFEPGDAVTAEAVGGEARLAELLAEGRIAPVPQEEAAPGEEGQTGEGQTEEGQTEPAAKSPGRKAALGAD